MGMLPMPQLAPNFCKDRIRMETNFKSVSLICLYLIFDVFSPQYSFPNPKFTLSQLPDTGWHSIFVSGINDLGKVVGTLAESNISTSNRHIFIWDRIDGIVDIGSLLPYENSSGSDINNSGQIVGYEWNSFPYQEHAFLYDETTGLIEIGTLLNMNWARSRPEKINNIGLVTGWATIGPGDSDFHAFVWTAADGLTDMTPELQPDTTSQDCNDSGSAVGSLTVGESGGYSSLFVWNNFNEIKVLGQIAGYDTLGYAINNNNQAVGCLYDNAWTFIPFMLDVDGSLTFLGSLTPISTSNHTIPLAINDRSQIVGHSWTLYGRRAFLWV
jgi:probable HAF family extracellular repeat protein